MGFKEDGARFVEGITFRDPKIGFAAGEVTRFVEKGRDDDEDDGRDFHYEHERHGRLPQSFEFLKQDKQSGTGRRGSKAGAQEAGSRERGFAQGSAQGYGQRYAQGYGQRRDGRRPQRGMRGYKNPGSSGYKLDRIKKQVKSLIMRKPAPLIIPGKKGGASQSSAVSSGVSANGTMGNIPGMGDSGNISGTGGFSSDNCTVSQAQNSAYDADNGDDASSMDRPGTDVKTVKKMDPAMSGTREPTKKPISRETRMAANKAAVSNMLSAKAEIERGIGSDKSTGDALNDGNSGVVRVITEMLNPMSHIKSVVYTLASLMLPHLITMFLTLTFIVVLITVVISAIMNAAGL